MAPTQYVANRKSYADYFAYSAFFEFLYDRDSGGRAYLYYCWAYTARSMYQRTRDPIHATDFRDNSERARWRYAGERHRRGLKEEDYDYA